MALQHQEWLEDVVIRLLCVFALDRFGDFVSDEVCLVAYHAIEWDGRITFYVIYALWGNVGKFRQFSKMPVYIILLPYLRALMSWAFLYV